MTTACLEKPCYESQLLAHVLPQGTKKLIKKFWYTNKTIEIQLGASKLVDVAEYAEKTKHIVSMDVTWWDILVQKKKS
jgi:hypothetical protein